MTLPLSYGSEVGTDSPATWRFKKYRAPDGSKTPLYNIQELNERPHVPILVVEDEKAAEAVKAIFPEMVVTTWQGGSSAVHLSDWVKSYGEVKCNIENKKSFIYFKGNWNFCSPKNVCRL
jgi:hypothetical protein